MTTKGFMRGNYIFDVDGKSILKIDTINEYSVYARTLDGKVLYEIKAVNIKLILVTKELLIKLEFKTTHGMVYTKGEFELVHEQGLFRLYIGSDWKDVDKIHQLQNLYFILKDELLEFKKEKDD